MFLLTALLSRLSYRSNSTIQVPFSQAYYPGFHLEVTLLSRFLPISPIIQTFISNLAYYPGSFSQPYYPGSHIEVTLLPRFLLTALLSRLAYQSNPTTQVPSHSPTIQAFISK